MPQPAQAPRSVPRSTIRRQLVTGLALSAILIAPLARAHASPESYQHCLADVKADFNDCMDAADGFLDKVGCNATGSAAFWGCTLKETVELAGAPPIYPAYPKP